MKKKIDVFEHMGEILNGVKNGVLITGKADGRVNSMTISWGMVGGCITNTCIQVANDPTRVAISVLNSNYTCDLIKNSGVFAISILDKNCTFDTIKHFGYQSGRDVDKAKEIGLTYEEPETISVPGVKELPLTLECKVVYKQTQDTEAMTEENREKFYPQNVESSFSGANRDTHIAYYGEIVDAYVIE